MIDDNAGRSVALVVEDEPLIAMAAVDLLTDDGFTVIEAWNADLALKLLDANGPVALLFTDVHMPGSMNGYELARRVAARWPGTHIIVCSGHIKPGTGDLPDRAVFINKPFSSQLVLDIIRRLTGGLVEDDRHQ